MINKYHIIILAFLAGTGCFRQKAETVADRSDGETSDVIEDPDDPEIFSEQLDANAEIKTIESANLPLAAHPALPRPVPIEVLVRTMADRFEVTWYKPRFCAYNPTQTYSQCLDVAYCNRINNELNRLYCNLGGEQREQASFIGTTLTAGDLILIWQFALTVCPVAQTADKLNAALRSKYEDVAHTLVSSFLGYSIGTEDYETEKNFIMTKLFKSAGGAETFTVDTDQIKKFGAACVYITTHPKLMTY